MSCSAGSLHGARYRHLAGTDRAEPRAWCHPGRSASHAGWGHALWASLAVRRPHRFGLFGVVARSRQAEHALCMWPALRFWPSGRFN
jgi:hypothetical protein